MKQSIIIRKARADDAAGTIATLRSTLAEEGHHFKWTLPEFSLTVEEERNYIAHLLESDNSTFLVAEYDGQIIGFLNSVGFERLSERHVTRFGINVHPDWRDKGVGTALIRHLITWAQETGIVKRIELEVFANNARGIHVYEKLGFSIEGRRRRAIYRDGAYIDVLIMGLWLEDAP